VLGAGIEAGEEGRHRAVPFIARTVGRSRGDDLPRVLVLAANQQNGRIRSSLSKDLVGALLIGPDVRPTFVSRVRLAPFSVETRPMNPTIHERERRMVVAAKPLASSTRDSVSFSEPSALPLTTNASACPLRALRRNSCPSDASMCSAARRCPKLATTTPSCPELAAGSSSDAIHTSSLTERPRASRHRLAARVPAV
jgi:hypothetical protein